MKIIDVPIYNEDGSIQFTQSISPEEAQALLQFSINFLTATGMYSKIVQATPSLTENPQQELKFND